MLICHLNVNKYQDLLSLLVEDIQEVKEKEGRRLYMF